MTDPVCLDVIGKSVMSIMEHNSSEHEEQYVRLQCCTMFWELFSLIRGETSEQRQAAPTTEDAAAAKQKHSELLGLTR
jgi:hypothetical protein